MASHLGTIEELAWNQGHSEVCFGVHVLLDLCVPQFSLGGNGHDINLKVMF